MIKETIPVDSKTFALVDFLFFFDFFDVTIPPIPYPINTNGIIEIISTFTMDKGVISIFKLVAIYIL